MRFYSILFCNFTRGLPMSKTQATANTPLMKETKNSIYVIQMELQATYDRGETGG